MYRVGIIGAGVGEKHSIAYKNHPDCSVKAICDFDDSKFASLEKVHPDASFFTDANLILNDKDIDVVSIASFDNYHTEQLLKAISNKKNVMVEKPMCLKMEELLKIKSSFDTNPDIHLSSNHVLRTNARFARFKNDISQRKLGEVYYIEADYYWGRVEKLSGWRSEMDFYSIILGAAIHMIDLVMWLLNSKPVSVQATGNKIATANTGLKYNSFSTVILEFDNGLIAKITGNGGCVHPHFHGLKIFGTERTAIHNLDSCYYLKANGSRYNREYIEEPYPQKESRENLIHTFIDSISNDLIVPLVSSQDVFDTMSVCFASEKAMSSGEKIIIEYMD